MAIRFKNVYIMAREGKGKNVREFTITTDTPLKVHNVLTFSKILPVSSNEDEDIVVSTRSYRIDGKIDQNTIVNLELQKKIMQTVLIKAKKFAGHKRIKCISFSFDPEDIKDFCIVFDFVLANNEEGPPDEIVRNRMIEALDTLGCFTFSVSAGNAPHLLTYEEMED